MKKISLGLFILAMIFALSGCGVGRSGQDPAQTSSSNNAKADPGADARIGKISTQEQLDEEERILIYLEKAVPEVREFRENVESYNQSGNAGCGLIIRIDAAPDPQSSDTLTRDYYCIYVGSDLGTHTSRWNSFYVKKDLTEVLVENLTGGSPMTVGQWRQVQAKPPVNEN
ncbi:MAG: lipoprotein [Deltaproteobacteria bacterium]